MVHNVRKGLPKSVSAPSAPSGEGVLAFGLAAVARPRVVTGVDLVRHWRHTLNTDRGSRWLVVETFMIAVQYSS